MDQFMPAIPLAGARIVVIGSGEAALNKLRLFRTAPCELVWCTLGQAHEIPSDLKAGTVIHTDAKADRRLKGARLAEVLEESADLPGAELLTWLDEGETPHRVRSESLNAVLETVCGEQVTAKTLRTWHGTHAAFLTALETRPATIKSMSAAAAERLQNTPAISRASYIHPRVVALSEKSRDDLDDLHARLGPAPDGLRRAEAELGTFLK